MIKDLKTAGYLFLVGLIFAGVIATVNMITLPYIEAYQLEKKIALQQEVIDATTFTDITSDFTDLNKNILEIVEAKDGDTLIGYVYRATVKGYGGKIDLLIGIDVNGLTTGIAVLSHKETPGFGADLLDDEDLSYMYLDQYYDGIDLTDPVIDTIAGITKTTGGIKDGLSVVFDHFNENLGDSNE